jgi:hypothetical protein
MRHLLQKKCWQTFLVLQLPVLAFCQVLTFKNATTDISHSSAACVLETENGYLVGGRKIFPGMNIDSDAYLISMDKTGQILWQKNYGDLRADYFWSLVLANDQNGYVAHGHIRNSGSMPGEVWVVRVDSLGNTLWETRLEQTLSNGLPNASILAVNDGYVVSSWLRNNNQTINLGSAATKINNNGTTLWSKLYTFGDSLDISLIKDYGIRHVEDSILYGSGTNGANAVFFTVDAGNGNMLSAIEFKHPDYSLKHSDLLKTPDGNFFFTGYIIEKNSPDTPSAQKWIWVAKISPDGQVFWSKTIPPSFLWFRTPFSWVSTDDGGIAGCATERRSTVQSDNDNIVALKLDGQGNTVLKKAISIENIGLYETVSEIIQTSDGGFMSVGSFLGDTTIHNLSIFFKTDSVFEVSNCCSKIREILPSDTFSIVSTPVSFTQTDYLALVPLNPVPFFTADLSIQDICRTPALRVTRTVQFCPGDTVWVAGLPYTQADTLYDVRLISSGFCDTLATYILQYSSEGYASNLSLQCPDNVVLQAPAGANSVPVTFTEPWAATDCPCPGLTNNLSSGFASGDLFPLGTTEVCYRAADECGNSRTCCFEVKVESPVDSADYCDEKVNGCVRFELAQVTQNSAGNWIYRVRLTNSCADPVRFAHFQVPDGIQSLEPTTGTGYTAPSGNAFAVRNPNFSPFYSIRFQPQSPIALANGQSETFRYVLPPQASVTHIHAATRLASGAFVETYLNTFGCEVGLEQKGGALHERGEETNPQNAIIAFPNPISVGSTLHILNVEAEDATFSLYDFTGSLIWTQSVFEGQVHFKEAKNGVYFFRIKQHGAYMHTGKVTVMNH